MKQLCSLALGLALALSLAACGGAPAPTESAAPVELTVFAAASLTESLGRIAELYKTAEPNVTLTFNFDSSGTLKKQIQEGAGCDLFISAGQKQMDQLDGAASPEANTEGLDLVEGASRVDLLENRVTLVVPRGNPKGIDGFDDLALRLREGGILLAMGNSDVPVGQYTQKILAYYGLDEAALASSGVLTYGSNVKEVATQVAEESVDCGVVYRTDAYSQGLQTVDCATAGMCGRAVYPAAVLKDSEHKQEAQAFLDYLTGDEATAVFVDAGFSRP